MGLPPKDSNATVCMFGVVTQQANGLPPEVAAKLNPIGASPIDGLEEEPEEPDKYNTTVFATVANNHIFQNTTLFVIVLNALWIGIDVEWNHTKLLKDGRLPLEPASVVVENFFCAYFTIELLIRFLSYRRLIYCVKDAWFVFDSLLVLFMVLETWVLVVVGFVMGGDQEGGPLGNLSSFRLLRLLRLTRMARIMRSFPELMTLVKGIVAAIRSVFFVLVFMLIVMYIFAIVFTSQIGDPEKEIEEDTALYLFSDIGTSMMSLLTHGVLGDNLVDALMAIKAESVWMMWLFIIFMIISGITLLNMLIGVLCQVIDESSKDEEEQHKRQELKACLETAFKDVDTSGDLEISKAEWGKIKDNDHVRRSLGALGIEDSQLDERLNQMQESLFGLNENEASDVEDDGAEPRKERRPSGLNFKDFAEKIMELRWDRNAQALDIEVLKALVRSEDKNMKKRLDRIEGLLKGLVSAAQFGTAGAGQPLAIKGGGPSGSLSSLCSGTPSNAVGISGVPGISLGQRLCNDSFRSCGASNGEGGDRATWGDASWGSSQNSTQNRAHLVKVLSKDSVGEACDGSAPWLRDVPAELLFLVLKSRTRQDTRASRP